MAAGEKTKLLWKSSQYREHMSKVHMGKPGGMLGKHHSEESKKKMGKKGRIPWNKGLKSNLMDSIKKCVKYINWRNKVFERDNWTCQNCKKRGSITLHPHHIKEKSLIVKENNIKTIWEAEKCEELWNISNGTTLCKTCHKLTENYGYKVYNKARMELAK